MPLISTDLNLSLLEVSVSVSKSSTIQNDFIWTGRTDSEDGEAGSRWHQKVEKQGIANGIGLVGFACDLGVINNKGRPGAKAGPNAIRAALANLAWHQEKQVLDAGTLIARNDLEQAQQDYATLINKQLQQQDFVIGLGGGHEIAWGSYNGLLNSIEDDDKQIGILNFDAHFDLRKPSPETAPKTSSGTPFYQIAKDCEAKGRDFKYACLGVAETANTKALFQVADHYQVRYQKDLDCELQSSKALLSEFLKDIDELYVTICLDVFHASTAPGVSAPSALGIEPNYVIKLLHWLKAQQQSLDFNWRLADIAEMNPKYDLDTRTAKLAARLVWEMC